MHRTVSARWPEHLRYLEREARPGQHVSIIGATGRGKTVLVKDGLLPLWRSMRTIIVDVKGDDPELMGLGHRIGRWPNATDRYRLSLWRGKRDPEWYRYVPRHLGEAGRQEMARVLRGVYQEGSWLIVLDEMRACTDARAPNYGLAPFVEQIWLRGRSKRVTLIACTQAPRWVPASAYEQISHLYLRKVPKERLRLLEGNWGIDVAPIWEALNSLGKYEWLYIGEGGDRMEIVKVER